MNNTSAAAAAAAGDKNATPDICLAKQETLRRQDCRQCYQAGRHALDVSALPGNNPTCPCTLLTMLEQHFHALHTIAEGGHSKGSETCIFRMQDAECAGGVVVDWSLNGRCIEAPTIPDKLMLAGTPWHAPAIAGATNPCMFCSVEQLRGVETDMLHNACSHCSICTRSAVVWALGLLSKERY